MQQRRYHWLNRRKLVILYCYLLLHQLHRSFISHRVITSNFLTANSWTTSISCRRKNQLFQSRSCAGQAKHLNNWSQMIYAKFCKINTSFFTTCNGLPLSLFCIYIYIYLYSCVGSGRPQYRSPSNHSALPSSPSFREYMASFILRKYSHYVQLWIRLWITLFTF